MACPAPYRCPNVSYCVLDPTSSNLGSYRQVAKESVLTLGTPDQRDTNSLDPVEIVLLQIGVGIEGRLESTEGTFEHPMFAS